MAAAGLLSARTGDLRVLVTDEPAADPAIATVTPAMAAWLVAEGGVAYTDENGDGRQWLYLPPAREEVPDAHDAETCCCGTGKPKVVVAEYRGTLRRLLGMRPGRDDVLYSCADCLVELEHSPNRPERLTWLADDARERFAPLYWDADHVYDVEEAVRFIARMTGVDCDLIARVLDAEEHYMARIGVMDEPCCADGTCIAVA
jgi:hypothetical protein